MPFPAIFLATDFVLGIMTSSRLFLVLVMFGGTAMNNAQRVAIGRVQDALMSQRNVRVVLRIQSENTDGLVFTEVDGVTVIIGVQGGYKIPAIRSYPTGVDSVVNVRSLWQQQRGGISPTRSKRGNIEQDT